MRNMAPAGPGVCQTCWTFIGPDYPRCYRCNVENPGYLDLVVPITYSEHLSQMHTALRNYKEEGGNARRFAAVRLRAILWRFLRDHEACVASRAGHEFDSVTVVPSTSVARDDDSPFRNLVWGIQPVKDRLARALVPTGEGSTNPRQVDPDRYQRAPDVSIDGSSVLLLDDTWATGGHAESAAGALLTAGAANVSLVVIGRHIQPGWEPIQGSGETCHDIYEKLPEQFDWEACAVE